MRNAREHVLDGIAWHVNEGPLQEDATGHWFANVVAENQHGTRVTFRLRKADDQPGSREAALREALRIAARRRRA